MKITTEQSSINKAWANVCKANVQPTAKSLLFESLQIDILHGFCGRVGWGKAKSLCSGNGCNSSDVSPSVINKVPVCLTNHSRKAHTVSLYRSQFYVFFQFPVLFANARSIEKQVHASCLSDKPLECFGCFTCCHVYPFYGSGANTLQQFNTSCSNTYCPALFYQQFCNL